MNRLFAVAACLIAFLGAFGAHAQSTSLSCPAGQPVATTIAPTGSVSVACVGTPAPTPGVPGTIAVTLPSVSAGGSGVITISRNGGSAGQIDAATYLSGDNCVPASRSVLVTFADGDSAAKSIPFSTTQAGTCYFVIGPANLAGKDDSAALLGAPTLWYTINVSAPATTACGYAPGVGFTLHSQAQASLQADIFYLGAGQIGYAQLPLLSASKTASVSFQTTTNSPGDGQVELWISQCPGASPESVPAACHVLAGGQNPTIFWEAATTGTAYDATMCKAFQGSGAYYLNFRYNYTTCAAGTCGYLVSWLQGPV